MHKKHEKWGYHYGEISEAEDIKNWEDFSYNDWGQESTLEFIQELEDLGVKDICFDVEDEKDYSDTLFFHADEKTNWRGLLVLLMNKRPDEFSEETPGHFRMWFD